MVEAHDMRLDSKGGADLPCAALLAASCSLYSWKLFRVPVSNLQDIDKNKMGSL